ARLRKFGRVAEAAVSRVITFLQLRGRVAEHGTREQQPVGEFLRGHLLKLAMELRRRIGHVTVPRLPELIDMFEQIQKTGPAVLALGREIGAAVKRLEIRREKTIQRPAALP